MLEDDSTLRIFVQIRKIETDRYDEGKKRGHDPREDGDYDLEWISANDWKNAKDFAESWDSCLCRTCRKAKECGFKLAKTCPFHWPKNNPSKKVVEFPSTE